MLNLTQFFNGIFEFLSDIQIDIYLNDISTFFFLFTILATPRISSKIDEAEPRGSVKAANESQETRGKKMSERNSKKTGWEYRTVWQGALRAVLLITGAIEAPAYLAARGASRNRDAPPVFATHLTRRASETVARFHAHARTCVPYVAVTPIHTGCSDRPEKTSTNARWKR